MNVEAQAPPGETPHSELRADIIASSGRTAYQAGGGVQLPAGYYARVGVIGAVGSNYSGGVFEKSARVDVVGRFLFDPFRQQRWGISAGAGVSLQARDGDRIRPLLLAVIDVEGPQASSRMSPAFQVGLGGGVRVGAALRWGSRTAR
ncbi:MAG: hypothetical protein JWM95_2916 [Gemmatimonadetes bacterium]|nr:hypothetical protein [Gemmatimonadota bacterium]